MQFRSTLDKEQINSVSQRLSASFKEAILTCLPLQGGLYIPTGVLDLRQFFMQMDDDISYQELITALTPPLFEGELNPRSAARLAQSAFDFEPELKNLDDSISILNLYNGPTGSFKDFGVAYFAAVLEELLENKKNAMILSAVRGDSGINIERSFYGRKRLTSVILFPAGPIRGLNPDTFVTNGGNIIAIQVRGNLDDCQRLVNLAINDRPFSQRYNITSSNAINPGRLLPQAFYYIYAFIKIKKLLKGELFFSVPSGNFGNLISGLYAWKFGLPVSGFIAAMNANNSLKDYFQGRKFSPRPVITTNSPALDVGNPSNFERLSSFYDEAPSVMRNMVFPASVDNTATLNAMEEAWKTHGEILDPHTAVAYTAAKEFINTSSYCNSRVIVLATGHPAREAALVKTASGVNTDIPKKLSQLKKEVSPIALIDPELDALEGAIASCV